MVVEFLKCTALVAAVRATAQGMVVIDPDGPTDAHRHPKLRSDVAAVLEAEGLIEIGVATEAPVTINPDDRKAAKAAEKVAAQKAAAERAVAKDPPALNDGTQGAATTAHPPGATDGLRDAGDGSPPLDDDGDKLPSASEIKGMNTANLTALAEAHGISFDDTHDTNAKRAAAIIAVLHPEK